MKNLMKNLILLTFLLFIAFSSMDVDQTKVEVSQLETLTK